MPAALAALRSRVEALSKTRRLPVGMTTETVAGAKNAVDVMTKTWSEAGTAFANGDVMGAVTTAQALKVKAAEAMAALGMQVPLALKLK